MNELYPLKFRPVFKDKIWGGQKIHSEFGMDIAPLQNCGEAWLLSGHGNDISIVTNGFLAGSQLDELIEVYLGDLVGDSVYEKHGNVFPLLIKILDSTDWLSVQVHPGDAMAERLNCDQGKTEMWYTASAEKGAKLISGFAKKVDPDIYNQHLQAGTLDQILQYTDVKAGDAFFIPAGRVHALGPGLLMFEIQQTSDLTYRIFDFNRVDDSGQPRELHTRLAEEAIDFTITGTGRVEYENAINKTVPIVECEYFKTGLLHFDQTAVKDYGGLDSFVVLLNVEGHCRIDYGFGSESLKPGELLLLPAITEKIMIIPGNEAKLLEIYVPQ